MPKQTIKTGVVSATLLFGLVGPSALAMPPQANAHAQAAHGLASPTDVTPSPQPGARLEAAKLRSCHNREKAITNIMDRIVDRGTKQIEVFDTIATRVETFYTSKGKTVAGYTQLTDAVAAAKTKATTDLAGLKATDNFSCDQPNPKGMVTAFQSALKLEIADLKAYRTAVRNLIVAVKSVDATKEASASESPKPSASPSATPTPSASPNRENQ